MYRRDNDDKPANILDGWASTKNQNWRDENTMKPKKPGKKNLTVRVDDDQKKMIDHIKERDGLSGSYVVRLALKKLFQEIGRQ